MQVGDAGREGGAVGESVIWGHAADIKPGRFTGEQSDGIIRNFVARRIVLIRFVKQTGSVIVGLRQPRDLMKGFGMLRFDKLTLAITEPDNRGYRTIFGNPDQILIVIIINVIRHQPPRTELIGLKRKLVNLGITQSDADRVMRGKISLIGQLVAVEITRDCGGKTSLRRLKVKCD